ncbi:MAG: acyl carrier protein [Acidobacteria bacterium]|nr:MAG: acyl carrier protein [Acidobacteriota bacterium]
MQATKQDVEQVFRMVFEHEDLEIFPQMTANDVENWDSFHHLNLILALEERFDVRFSSEEIAGMEKVDDLFWILGRHGVEVSW